MKILLYEQVLNFSAINRKLYYNFDIEQFEFVVKDSVYGENKTYIGLPKDNDEISWSFNLLGAYDNNKRTLFSLYINKQISQKLLLKLL